MLSMSFTFLAAISVLLEHYGLLNLLCYLNGINRQFLALMREIRLVVLDARR